MSKKNLSWKLEYLLLSIVLILSFILRLYKINSPLADWHSWRQADTSAVSRNFLKSGFDLLHPKFDDLSSIPSGKENPQGYRFVEFPVYNLFQAGMAKIFPQKSLEWWGRMISIIFSSGSLLLLYLIARKYLGKTMALWTAFFFGVLPFNIYYSRAILPEPMMVFTSLGMIYFFGRWIENSKLRDCFLAILMTAVSFLLKPFTLFLLLPIFYLGWEKWQFNKSKWLTLLFFYSLALLPFLSWRWWMGHFPEGVPAYTWLLNEGGIRFKGAFFRWLFAERLGKLILGYWGLVPFVLGILAKPGKKEGWFFHWWLVAILAYFTVFAGGNVRHDYYQIIAIPIICIFLAKGANFLLFESKKIFNHAVCCLLLVVCCLSLLAFSWYEVRGFFNINHPEIVEAGKIADRILPADAKVIAPYNGDTTFLYQINRQGWPAITGSIDYLISQGATNFVSVNLNDETTKNLLDKYRVLEKTKKIVIVDLRQPK